jgi:glutamyl-tRNA(Gln) amidotransferase subunit E
MKEEKLDYKKIGLMCGIEIHQQLDTNKLFCNCPSIIRDDPHDVEVTRKLKAVVGETGEVDAAAAHEALINKQLTYQGYSDTTCSIEFDEEPPRLMNKKALEVVLQVSKILNAHIIDEIQVMRKTVVDGSNTSGFQRTALVARHGNLKTDFGNIGIPTIIVEEDAAKIVEQDADHAIYNLSRLGIPLIEIGTDPDIRTPEQAKEVALKLGLVLRSTGKVKRGLGTIRQDLNVSVTKGTRVEMKGAQDLKLVPTWVENEARRQLNLIELKSEFRKFKCSVLETKQDITDIFKKTDCKIISAGLKKGGVVKALKMKNYKGLLGREIQPGKRFGSELSDYAKVKSGVKGLFHSDEKLQKYSLSKKEINAISKKLDCKENDGFILISDDESKVDIALDAVIFRAKLAFKEIPGEVRRANPDGTSTFMRPIPGAARMYPETDCMPISVVDMIDDIKIPEMIEAKERRYKSMFKLNEELAKQVARFDYSSMKDVTGFDILTVKYSSLKPAFLAETLVGVPKELRRKYNIEVDDSIYQHVFFLLDKLNKNEITKESFLEILADLAKGKKVDFSKYKCADDSEVESEIKKIIKDNKGAPFGALMGKAMAKFRGKVEGKKISDVLKKFMK